MLDGGPRDIKLGAEYPRLHVGAQCLAHAAVYGYVREERQAVYGGGDVQCYLLKIARSGTGCPIDRTVMAAIAQTIGRPDL